MSGLIGDRLKEALKRKKISAKEFGKLIGKSEQMIYKYYNYNTFDSNQIIEFSKLLKLPISYWFDDYSTLNQSIANGNGSAASVFGNATVGTMADKEKEIEHLKQLLEEKERTIQILMNR